MEALVITHNAPKQFIETIKPLEKNLISKRGKSCARESPLVLLLFLIGWQNGARFLDAEQKYCKCELLSTVKTALLPPKS